MLKVGDIAPDFSLADQNGSVLTLDEAVKGGDVILYFYPADFSPVCSAQTCAFRDNYAGVESIGATVVGISPQSVASHARFASTFAVPFPLLADPRKKAIRAYGVDGPLGMGVRRATFLIDQNKVVRNRVVSDLFVESHMDLLKKTLRDSRAA